MADKIDLMTKKEVQAYLRCSHQTLYRYMTKLGLPYLKLDRRVLFRRKDIDAFLEKKLVK